MFDVWFCYGEIKFRVLSINKYMCVYIYIIFFYCIFVVEENIITFLLTVLNNILLVFFLTHTG